MPTNNVMKLDRMTSFIDIFRGNCLVPHVSKQEGELHSKTEPSVSILSKQQIQKNIGKAVGIMVGRVKSLN